MKLSDMDYRCRYIVTEKSSNPNVSLRVGDSIMRGKTEYPYIAVFKLNKAYEGIHEGISVSFDCDCEIALDRNWYESEIESYKIGIRLAKRNIRAMQKILDEHKEEK